ncbi:fibrous sheath-interacting protein 2-like isoform X1 [Astyanax mexicanus]|uniref:fibrous sheath-interacting protein 2-like isoform X1 n=1 Tax=Astyanax mexicanus TaxID=7994 RepID=UPI0020CAE217|nr:fibrous sheath-interacting protein 2-like isoform X1 [Astyanax mexicanus]
MMSSQLYILILLESSRETEGDLKREDMFDLDKMDFSALMAKPKGTKVFVPDKCKVQFFRGKLGQSLSPDKQDCDFGDPKMSKKLGEYNCLHDKYLKKFFRHPMKKKQLVKLGIISQDGKVRCSVKEFNEYVEHLKSTPLKQDTSEFKQPSLQMTCQFKGSSRPEKKIKKETEELRLIDLEEEGHVSVEDLKQTPRKEKVEDTSEFKQPSVQMTCQSKGSSRPEKKERRMKQKLTNPDVKDERTLLAHSYTLERDDDDQVFDFKTEKESEELRLIDLEEEEQEEEEESFQTEVADVLVEDIDQTPREETVEMTTSKPILSPETEKKLKKKKSSSLTWVNVQESSSTQENMEEASKEGDSRGSIWSIFKKVWKAVKRPKSAPPAI